MMTKMPVAGIVWLTVPYLVGLRRLGYDVYYVEAHARTPSMLMTSPDDDGAALAAGFVERIMRRFSFEHRWAYHALHSDGRVYGLSEPALLMTTDCSVERKSSAVMCATLVFESAVQAPIRCGCVLA